MAILKKGENALIRRNLLAVNGTTPILLSSLVFLHAHIIQYGRLFATFTYLPTPSPVQNEIRQGESTSQIEVEITKELSLLFREGAVTMKLIMEQTDASFETDGELRDIDEFEIFQVEA